MLVDADMHLVAEHASSALLPPASQQRTPRAEAIERIRSCLWIRAAEALLGTMVNEMGAAANAALVLIGD